MCDLDTVDGIFQIESEKLLKEINESFREFGVYVKLKGSMWMGNKIN